jgi:hypothetical protein
VSLGLPRDVGAVIVYSIVDDWLHIFDCAFAGMVTIDEEPSRSETPPMMLSADMRKLPCRRRSLISISAIPKL